MTNNIAPIQKRVISALDILSVSSDTVVLLELFQKERIFWMIDMLDSVGTFPWPFLTVFLSVLLFAISLVWNFFANLVEKNGNSGINGDFFLFL